MEGSRLKSKGSPWEVTSPCPAARMGLAEVSTLGISPSVKLWRVAVAATWSRLAFAVNGLSSVKYALATPDAMILVGNIRKARAIKDF